MSLEGVQRLGQENGDGFSEDDWVSGFRGLASTQIATIVYTSGTTGPPKGVVLTHGNFLEEIAALSELFEVDRRHTALFFLPIAHIFARVIQFWQLSTGCTHTYGRGLDKVAEDLKVVRPHFFASVPRIFEKIHERIQASIRESSAAKRLLLKIAPFLLSLKIRKIFGGRLDFTICGGAPLSTEIAGFFDKHGVKIMEGYGLTETTAGIFINTKQNARFGTVGRAVRGVRVKIAQDGEILIKSPTVFQGYYRDPAATRRAFTRDGWFKTGDIGEIDADGFLRITDRKKDLIITAAGKNISPQNIEGRLKSIPFISQAMVFGDRRKYLTALVTLNREAVTGWMRRRGIRLNGRQELAGQRHVRRLIRTAIEEKNKSLASFETIKRFQILENDFTHEAGELTPTMKLKRKFVSEKYRDVLEGLYR